MPCPNCRCPSCLALPVDPPAIPFKSELPLPPAELMTTNRAPTDSEVAHSRDIIRSAEKLISLAQKTIRNFEKRKAEALGLISTHKAAISPMRSFPPELLAEVFAALVTMAKIYWDLRSQPPLMLMGVCSRWRKIVLDTPRLWIKIFGLPSMPVDPWIIRSKELPLYVELNSSFPSILEALVPHSYRWEHVGFSLEAGLPSVLARVKTRLHLLKRLNIFFGPATTGTVDFCEVAPQLTEVSLIGIYQPVIIQLPWEQLEVCTLDNSGLALYILQHAKNLQICHLDMSELFPPGPWLSTPRDPHSYNPRLDTLVVRWSLLDLSTDIFFSSITLPSLQTLEVDFDSTNFHHHVVDDPPELTRSTMSGFFKRSSKHLSTLNLTNIPFSSSILIECLALVPSLVSLDIHFDEWHEISDKLLHRLNISLPGYILPRLRSLSLRGPSVFSSETLDALVTSRRYINPINDGTALLKNLTLKCTIPEGQSTDSDRLPRFHRFVSGGLNIVYGWHWDVYNSIRAKNSKSLGERV
ncbi:hypothetical protein BD779DRAFT_919240 [Infundibulicybe gibba]|nr:hypothetical protein BD779DRAFT_919240 [Infundibulicybe gibba]